MAPVSEETPEIYRQLLAAQLPALPQILLEVMELCEREDAGLAEIAALVHKDAAISARILSIAHSPYYNRGKLPGTLEQCLAVLGTLTVRRIALNQAVTDLFDRFQSGRAFDLGRFWRHSLMTATLARLLAEQFAYAHPEEAYLAGLLHDVGQLALLRVKPDLYGAMLGARLDEALMVKQEQLALGVDHAEVGAWLAARWQLDPLFVDSLQYHHESAERLRSAHPLAQIVALADRLGNQHAEAGSALDEMCAGWGLAPETLASMRDTASNEVKRIASDFGIALPEDTQADAAAHQAPDDLIMARLAKITSTRILAQGALAGTPAQPSLESTYAALVQAASLLFGSRRAALFLPADGMLQGHSPDDQDPRVQEIRIRLPAPNSAIGRAYEGQAEILDQGGANGSLADTHVRHLLGGESLLCLPLAHAHLPMGVLALSLDAARAQALRQKPGLLAAFASEAGRQFHQARQHEADLADARQTLTDQYQLRSRQVIHEVSNPLGVVRNYLAILRSRLADHPSSTREIDLMREELRRVDAIMQGLKQTDLNVLPQSRPVDLNGLLEGVLQVCRTGRPGMERIHTLLCLDDGVGTITTDADKLKQILMNLILNALEAMPEGGRLTLSSVRWHGGKGEETVEIGVEDSGMGIPPEVLQHLYTPVQSRKGEGHAGLGLSIVGRLVEELGGVIQCKSTKSGTSFKLMLPVAATSTATGDT